MITVSKLSLNSVTSNHQILNPRPWAKKFKFRTSLGELITHWNRSMKWIDPALKEYTLYLYYCNRWVFPSIL